METRAYVKQMRLDGGHPALDFVNTLGGPEDGAPAPHDEFLRGYPDVAVWAARTGLIEEASMERLLRRADRHADEAASVFERALELRSLVDRVFRPLAHGRPPTAEARGELGEMERAALARASLARAGEGYGWVWPADDDLEAPLSLVTHAAVDLLTSGPLDRLKLCGKCRWLFLDLSKNQSRRWCSMAECGTATKKRRYVERRRARRAARAEPR